MSGNGFACCRGFALLLTMGLLGVIASALVALTALVVQESMASALAVSQAQARENARLALLEALGSLQQHAGPDGIVTARAQMLGRTGDGDDWNATAEALAWTGVWPAAGASQAAVQPVWLVSGGQGVSPLEALAADEGIELVAARPSLAPSVTAWGAAAVAASGWAAVKVPLVSLPQGAGAYGWWVGDEGVKVNIGAPTADAARARAWLANRWPRPELERVAMLLPGPDVDTLLPPVRVATLAGGSGAVTAAAATPLRAADAPVASVALPLEDAALRARLFDLADVAYLADGRPDAADTYASALFHEVTLSSRGVLADPQTGLRADYSLSPDSFPLGGEFARYADYTQAMEPPLDHATGRQNFIPTHNDLRRRYRMRAAEGSPAMGEVSSAIAPVLTDCYLLFNVHRVHERDRTEIDERDPNWPRPAHLNRVMIHAGMMVELWNPYTSALVPAPLLLEVSGLPTQVVMRPQGVGMQPRTVALASALSNGPSGSWWIELPFTDKEYAGQEQTWFPGRVYNWTGPNNFADDPDLAYSNGSSGGSFLNRTLNQSIWAQLTTVEYPASGPPFAIEVPAQTRLTVRLRLKQGDASTWASAPVLAEIRDVAFDRIPATGSYNANWLPYQFGFRIRLEDPGTLAGTGSGAAWEKSRWLRRADPRTTSYSGSAIGAGAPGSVSGGASYYVPSRNPLDYVQSGSKGALAIDKNDELWNRQMGDSGRLQLEDAPLFELPRQDLLRVADLRHLHLVGQRAYAIGNRWGADTAAGDVNRVFDLGFFSGLGSAGGGGTALAATPLLFDNGSLPDERLLPQADYATLVATGADSARHLLLHGAFNLNTLSPSAWRAVLVGLRQDDFSYIATDPGNGDFNPARPTRSIALGAAVSRFGHSAGETFDPGNYLLSDYRGSFGSDHHNPSVEPPTSYFRQGIVALSEAHLDLLATAIAERIGTRASGGLPPFRSFAEFLGPVRLEGFRHPREANTYMSILEAAVYDVMSDTSLPAYQRLNRDASGNPVWWDTPSFVNGGDLWAQFAHYAAVRSDTFRIRAYGRSGAGGAQAWCEAIVQRLPEPFEVGAAASASALLADVRKPQSAFGRGFRIVSVRWLRQDEL